MINMKRTETTTKRTTTETIPVLFEDFVRHNASMLKLLFTLQEMGGTSPTNILYIKAHKSNNFSRPWLLKAEKLGYITRRKTPMPQGKSGNNMIINTLTPKGIKLLEKVKEYSPKI
jgi:hypothetical protein